MGEAVASSECGIELEVQRMEAEIKKGASDGSSLFSVVRWESFLSKMAVRVLLVEADDSTRQIIAALLRKCSYRVAAVSDGLKAWEVLKGRPHSIDLILTEVELPSISGYALLTLIMEHHICKTIPVIMMSSNDSVSTVYKCMLRGAADFLVKPVRKNELRNLWQHVWRKQASSRNSAAGPGPPDESASQQKVEATAENNAVSNNHSSDYIASNQRNRECIDKGSDAQSSCTKPELENGGTEIEHIVHCLSQSKNSKFLSDYVNLSTQDQCCEESRHTHLDHYKTSDTKDANNAVTRAAEKESDCGWERVNVTDQTSENNHRLENSCGKAIDLIGAFDNYLKTNLGSFASNISANKLDVLPLLDLSLKRSHQVGSVNQTGEKQRLNHSDASAFSKYRSKPLQQNDSPSPSTCNQQKDQETTSERQQSNHTTDYNSDTHGQTLTSLNHVSVTDVQSGQQPQRSISLPIPAKGVRIDNMIIPGGSVVPALHCVNSDLSTLPSPCSAHHSESFLQLNSPHPLDRQPSNSQNLGNLVENQGSIPLANDPSVHSSFCDGIINQHYNTCSGYNGKINSFTVVNTTVEYGNEESFLVQEGASHRSVQREAALTKFRLKRKDRCFEKKVRYESRKKLAEQRPRVKGQFVRQVPNDPQPETS